MRISRAAFVDLWYSEDMLSNAFRQQIATLAERFGSGHAKEITDDDLDWLNIVQQHGQSSARTASESGVLPALTESEGELAVDVWHDATTYYIRTAIAGVEPDDLDIMVSNDTVGIAGARAQQNLKSGQNFLASECHWGRFSRTIVLPSEINPAKVSAQLKNGILLVTAPKLKAEGTFRVPVVDKSVRDDAFGLAH